jgi:hypothetical protein
MTQAFTNQGPVAGALGVWMFFAVGLAIWASTSDVSRSEFFEFGPNATVQFLGASVDSWPRWSLLMSFTVVTQALKILADEVISPWILHVVMNDGNSKVRSYVISQVICQLYYGFSCIVRFFQVSVSVSQVDFVLALLITDLVVSFFTTDRYLRNRRSNSVESTAVGVSLHELQTELLADAGAPPRRPEFRS